MVALAAKVVIFLAAFAGMEAFAWAMHRYVMHGALWCWHRSHHEPRDGMFELNDLFAVTFAMPAILFIWLGVNVSSWWLSLGLGITAYGAAYAVFHDGLVHQRFPVPLDGRRSFWRARVQAHRIHHAVITQEGCVSFGFLWVRPIRELKVKLAAGAQLISALVWMGYDIVEVAPTVGLGPNMGNLFWRRWKGLSPPHLRLTERSEAYLRGVAGR